MSAAARSVVIHRGANVVVDVARWADEALSVPAPWPAGTYTAELRDQLETPAGDRGVLLVAFTVDVTAAAAGVLRLRLTDEQSNLIPPGTDRAYFDVVRTVSGEPYPMLARAVPCVVRQVVTAPGATGGGIVP